MKILVTGAAGSVGFEVVNLLLDKGYEVLALDLPQYEYMFQDIYNLHFIGCDLNQHVTRMQPGLSYLNYMNNIDGIINTAAIVDLAKPYHQIQHLNTHLPYHLRRTFKYSAMVHISTGSIYLNNGNTLTERTPIKIGPQCKSAYESSKSDAETILYEHFPCSRTTILRPSLIYGPRAGYLGAALAAIPPMMKEFTSNPIGFRGGPKTNWVHCKDVARAAVWSLERYILYTPAVVKSFNVYNICDDTPHAFGDTITKYLIKYGLWVNNKIPLPSPKTLKKFKFFLDNKYVPKVCNGPAQLLWNALKHHYKLDGKLHVAVDKEMMDYLFQDTIFSNEKIKNDGFELDYPDSHDEIVNTINWYRDNRWIP